MDRLKKRRLRENPEFREKEKKEAKGRMRALRSDPAYRYLQDCFNDTALPFRSILLSSANFVAMFHLYPLYSPLDTHRFSTFLSKKRWPYKKVILYVNFLTLRFAAEICFLLPGSSYELDSV